MDGCTMFLETSSVQLYDLRYFKLHKKASNLVLLVEHKLCLVEI